MRRKRCFSVEFEVCRSKRDPFDFRSVKLCTIDVIQWNVMESKRRLDRFEDRREA